MDNALSTALNGWSDWVKSEKETPPDIHTADSDFWGVRVQPQHGKACIGLVTRANNTQECIAQKLTTPMHPGHQYRFAIYLAQSDAYVSHTVYSGDKKLNFTAPTVLRLWGGSATEKYQELLAESEPVDHHDWRAYEFDFRPLESYPYLIIQAYYADAQKKVEGNLLLDNAQLYLLSN